MGVGRAPDLIRYPQSVSSVWSAVFVSLTSTDKVTSTGSLRSPFQSHHTSKLLKGLSDESMVLHERWEKKKWWWWKNKGRGRSQTGRRMHSH